MTLVMRQPWDFGYSTQYVYAHIVAAAFYLADVRRFLSSEGYSTILPKASTHVPFPA